MKKATLMTASLAIGLASAALAHKGATGIVKERMVAMAAMSEAIKTVSPMMSGEATYDPDAVRGAAKIIAEHAGTPMTQLFPDGHDNKASFVKPEIWEDWDSFAKMAEDLRVYADGLALAADKGVTAGSGDMMAAGDMMGTGSMMGTESMMGTAAADPVGPDFATMSADVAFANVSETCSSCHTRFRNKVN